MPCNCGQKQQQLKYVYTAPDGTSKTYNSEVEARAAQIRNGGGTYTSVPR